ncbi:hypothetical protein DPMN_142715 [Dreissena polymorpha]|uniref:DUF6589 domain-containing protein n=1 Tax=Dreissena polymorpha TaxID=45954 RepID=A0A9D4JIY2_DREPO|nr:hypothetical protein DPMN_142715 [Dreissena polymorpha]
MCPFLLQCESPERIELEVEGQKVSLPVENGKVSLIFQQQTGQTRIEIPTKLLEEKETIQIPVGNLLINVKLVKPDDLKNYVMNFMQHNFIILNLKDAVKEGDVFRINNCLKMMIPFFYNHSPLSNYMVECLDYTLKTEVMLPPKLAIQVRAAACVNPKGAKAKKKAADMQKENQVKEMKELIKGLGSNKNEHSIETISKAYPVVNDIVSHIDLQISYKEVKSSHKSRSENEDMSCLLKHLRNLKPFCRVSGRTLDGYCGIKTSAFKELLPQKALLKEKVMQIINYLKRGIPMPADENEENVEDIVDPQ